jgi:hypothetical protein
MTTMETYRYRGYDIVPMWQWSSWCTGIYPTRADLPILPRSTLSTMAPERKRPWQATRRSQKLRNARKPRLSLPRGFSFLGTQRPNGGFLS